ncbi:MAG: hypothetical protein OXL40_05350 [Bacteroidota bacterium]|nr:hypothetical protein [Bacteroidota bacterium]
MLDSGKWTREHVMTELEVLEADLAHVEEHLPIERTTPEDYFILTRYMILMSEIIGVRMVMDQLDGRNNVSA